MSGKFIFVLIFAIVIDAVDYVGGFIPILGDIIDLIGVVVFAVSGMGVVSGIGLLELIPFADFLPLHVIAVLIAKVTGRFNPKR